MKIKRNKKTISLKNIIKCAEYISLCHSPTFNKSTEKYLWKMKWKPIDLKFYINSYTHSTFFSSSAFESLLVWFLSRNSRCKKATNIQTDTLKSDKIEYFTIISTWIWMLFISYVHTFPHVFIVCKFYYCYFLFSIEWKRAHQMFDNCSFKRLAGRLTCVCVLNVFRFKLRNKKKRLNDTSFNGIVRWFVKEVVKQAGVLDESDNVNVFLFIFFVCSLQFSLFSFFFHSPSTNLMQKEQTWQWIVESFYWNMLRAVSVVISHRRFLLQISKNHKLKRIKPTTYSL